MADITPSFKAQELTRLLLGAVPERAQDVLEKRFGLASGRDRMTLEAIGQGYGITRERVRQIEKLCAQRHP